MPFCVFVLFLLDTNKPERNGNEKQHSFYSCMSKKRCGEGMVHLIIIIIVVVVVIIIIIIIIAKSLATSTYMNSRK